MNGVMVSLAPMSQQHNTTDAIELLEQQRDAWKDLCSKYREALEDAVRKHETLRAEVVLLRDVVLAMNKIQA